MSMVQKKSQLILEISVQFFLRCQWHTNASEQFRVLLSRHERRAWWCFRVYLAVYIVCT
jgi:hypothetical protein